MSMEKITKEELQEKFGVPLSDDELENVAGGGGCRTVCHYNSAMPFEQCLRELCGEER